MLLVYLPQCTQVDISIIKQYFRCIRNKVSKGELYPYFQWMGKNVKIIYSWKETSQIFAFETVIF